MSPSRINPTPVSLLERLRRPPEQAQEAWRTFVHLYTPLLFAWARRLGVGGADAADLVQDVFTLLVGKLPDFSYRQGRFRGWLWTVLLNKYRQNCRRQQGAPAPAGDEALADLPDGDNVAAWAEAEYQRHIVTRALETLRPELSETTWRAFQLYVIQEKPAAEVAAALDVSVNVVHLAKSRVLQRLREELRGLLD